MTALLPCVTFGQIAEVLDEGEMSKPFMYSTKFGKIYSEKMQENELIWWWWMDAACPLGSFIYMLMMPAVCSQWIMGSKYRSKLRNKYGLVEAPYSDVVSHIFCPCCALCQESRELKSRGLDPTLGNNFINCTFIYSFCPTQSDTVCLWKTSGSCFFSFYCNSHDLI